MIPSVLYNIGTWQVLNKNILQWMNNEWISKEDW